MSPGHEPAAQLRGVPLSADVDDRLSGRDHGAREPRPFAADRWRLHLPPDPAALFPRGDDVYSSASFRSCCS